MSTASMLLGSENTPEAERLLGIINVSGKSWTATGSDPLAPPTGNQRNGDFDPAQLNGSGAFIKINYERIVKTWVRNRSHIFRTLEPALTKRIHRRTGELLSKQKDKSAATLQACFHAAWKETMGDNAPTASAAHQESVRRESFRQWFKANGLPYDDRWTLDQMADYQAHPERIHSQIAAEALADEVARIEREERDAEAVLAYGGPAPTKPGEKAVPKDREALAADLLDSMEEPVLAAPKVLPGIEDMDYLDDEPT